MVRLLVGLAAWMAGTVIAVCVALLGANVVIRNAGVEPGIPVLNAAVLTPSATSSPSPTPHSVTPQATKAGRTPGTGRAAIAGRTPPKHTVPAGTYLPASGTGPTPSASTSVSVSASASASVSAPAGNVRAYTLVGGNVTLQVTDTTVQLVTAVPAAGYSVMQWSGTDWLRVDFSEGTRVSSLIASWYEHAPTITVTNG